MLLAILALAFLLLRGVHAQQQQVQDEGRSSAYPPQRLLGTVYFALYR